MFYKIFLVFLTLLFSVVALARGQVKLENDELFELSHGVGAFTLGERVNSLEARIKNIAKDREVNVIELRVEEFENSSNIVIGDRVVVTITERDAAAVSLTRQAFAKNIRDKLVSSIKDYRKINSWKKYALSVAYAIISTLILIFLFTAVRFNFQNSLS